MRKFRSIFSMLVIISLVVYTPLAAKKDPNKKALKGFDAFITKTMEEWKVPGLAISIVKDGKLIYAKGFGNRDIEKGLEVTPETLFAIGSCTKAFTAATMGILVDDGKLDWNKPVSHYLPTFKLKDSFASEKMTPRDLVCHNSGLPRHDFMWYNSLASRKELFDRLQYLKPSKDFRVVFQYQNLMFMTAGYLVGQTAGVPWEKFVKTKIFDPLGMNDSNFSVEDSKKAQDFALPYMEKDEKIIEIPFRNIDTIGPAGSINSNVTNMANWILLNLNKGKFGEKQIISEASIQEIHSPQMISSKSFKYDESFYSMYGMGWGITSYRGHVLLRHGGGIDGFTASVSLMPRDNMGIVILTNLSGTPLPAIIFYNAYDRLLGLNQIDWNKRVREQVDKAKEEAEKAKKEKQGEPKSDTQLSHTLGEYVGEYGNPGYGILSIAKEGEGLKMTYSGIDYEIKHFHYDVFEMKNELYEISQKVSFSTDLQGNIGSLAVPFEPSVDPIVFTRMPEKKMMERSFLEQFVGEYVLGEITSKIYIKGENTLFALVPGQPEYELIPYRGTEFKFKSVPGVTIEFILDESGKVIEAKVTQPEGVFRAKKK